MSQQYIPALLPKAAVFFPDVNYQSFDFAQDWFCVIDTGFKL